MGGRRFWPVFVCQFCAALGENTLKSALAILVLWVLPAAWGGPAVALAGATLVLPFLLLSPAAGRLADRHDRAGLARRIKAAEILCTIPVLAGLALGSAWMVGLLYLALLGYGVCAALFGPVKYALLPDLLPARHLPAANAAVETSTFLAILAGTFGGGLNGSALLHAGLAPRLLLGGGLLGIALLARLAAGWIPAAPVPSLVPPLVPPGAGMADPRLPARAGHPIGLALAAGAWFWLAGSVAMALLPVLVRQSFGGDARTAALALGMFALGIAPGAALAALWQRGRIRFAPALAGMAGMGLAMLDLWRRAPGAGADPAAADWRTVLAHDAATGAAADLVAIAICAGLVGVPAASILQAATPAGLRARMVARGNMLSAGAMVAGALAIAALQAAGLPAASLFGATGGLGLALAAAGAAVLRRRT